VIGLGYIAAAAVLSQPVATRAWPLSVPPEGPAPGLLWQDQPGLGEPVLLPFC